MWDVQDLEGLGGASLGRPVSICDCVRVQQLRSACGSRSGSCAFSSMYPDLVDWVRVLLDGDFSVLVGVPRFTMQVFLDGDFAVSVGVLAFWMQGLLDGDFAVLVGVTRFTMQVFLDGDFVVFVGVLAFWTQGLLDG